MSYTRSHSPLGGITDAASAVATIATDPCLPQITGLVNRLHASEQTPARPGQPASSTPGIGLCKAVRPLRTVVWLKEKPWRIPVVVGGVVGFLFLAGVAVGRNVR